MVPPATPSQTAGPFVSIGTEWAAGRNSADEQDPESIVVSGVVYDGAGAPVTDAMLEFWQAGLNGQAQGTGGGWAGFARVLTGESGRYRLVTKKPPRLPAGEGAAPEAPHIDVSIFARGLLQRLVTRIYFPDEPSNSQDAVLSSLSDEVRARLTAQQGVPGGDDGRHIVYEFDIHLQGEQETVFFAPW